MRHELVWFKNGKWHQVTPTGEWIYLQEREHLGIMVEYKSPGLFRDKIKRKFIDSSELDIVYYNGGENENS